tara:strand:+ start:270 stop:596 length:327 start_codon:yes stop_codon:yes gene_type:complete
VSKLLETRLPLAVGGIGTDTQVDVETFNRLVRVLEINLGSVDFTISPHFNSTQISTLQFATGAIIFNTTNQIHQAFDGNALRDLYSHQTYPAGQVIESGLGTVTVNTP